MNFFRSAIDESLKRCEKSLPGSQYRTRARMLSIFSSVGNGLQDINFNSLPPRSRSPPASVVHIACRPQHRPDHLSWLSRTWGLGVQFAFFPFACFLVGCRARLNARVELGALNAGRAWVLGGGAVDGFGQSLFFQFSWVVLRGFSFFIGLQ